MYRIWHSSEDFANYLIAHTNLKNIESIRKTKLIPSDASDGRNFHKTPDHIKSILYLDCPDIIVEKNGRPIFTIEVSTEAGTGHNVFQRFARLAASAENSIPAFYIYPKGSIITRSNGCGWDTLNPLIFKALESVKEIFKIPVLLYYFPSDIDDYFNNPEDSPNSHNKGLRYCQGNFRSCPDPNNSEMQEFFSALNEIINSVEKLGIEDGIKNLTSRLVIRNRIEKMHFEYSKCMPKNDRSWKDLSPLSSTSRIPTTYILNYIKSFFALNDDYFDDSLLETRAESVVYMANAKFRGDPYPGCLAAIDYLTCREGPTYEDRKNNLVLVFGKISVDEFSKSIVFDSDTNKKSTIEDYSSQVESSSKHNLLTKNYFDLSPQEIPRYYMQVRHGSKFSKSKEIRVFAYFADVILFPNGILWREG